jgi:transcriptional regulator with XRE-family HTH domain
VSNAKYCASGTHSKIFVKLAAQSLKDACLHGKFKNHLQPTSVMDTAPTLGSGLKSAREARNLSLRQVEEATGISNAYISQLENDKVKKPSPHFLHKLSSLYDVPYDLLMEYAGYIKRAAEAVGPRTLAAAAFNSQAQLSAAGVALSSQAQLTDEEAAQLLDYLGYLRSKNKTK